MAGQAGHTTIPTTIYTTVSAVVTAVSARSGLGAEQPSARGLPSRSAPDWLIVECLPAWGSTSGICVWA